MSILLLYFVYRVIAAQARGFFSFGLIKRNVEVSEEKLGDKGAVDFFAQPDLIPHAWYFAVQLTLVALFANADINSRVASTCPFYFWAFAAIVCE